MLRTVLLASVAAVAISASAQAADLPVSVPAAIPQAAPVYNWTGFYVGANAGYSWMNGDARYTGGPGAALNFLPGGYGIEADGFIGGGQLGFNYQINQFVVGLEADIQYTDLEGGTSVTTGFPGGFTTLGRATTGLDWLGTVRGRVGFAVDRVLVYGTGGLAFGEVNVSGFTTDNSIAPLSYAGARSDTRTGWTAGAGVEWAFMPNFTVKLEYLYYDLGDVNLTLNPTSAAAAGSFLTQNHEIDGHVVRAGVNFRF